MIERPVRLIAVEAGNASQEIAIDRLPVLMGRGTDTDICIEDRWVSRHHCEIRETDSRLTVRDLDSKHGTYLNGKPVEEAPLRDGDELTVGLSRFRLQLGQEEEASSTPSLATGDRAAQDTRASSERWRTMPVSYTHLRAHET